MNALTLKKIKDALPFGAMAGAARKFHISESAVSQIMSGKSENVDVVEYLSEIAHSYQKMLDKIDKQFGGKK
jgi:hypothetical protein